MKNILANSLRCSLEEERKVVKQKDYGNLINDKFVKANQVLNSEITNFNNCTKNDTHKVIRDTFSILEKDYELINFCKNKLLTKHYSANKSEIVRAGLIVLSQMSDEEILLSIQKVEKIKTGRPKHS